MVNDGTLLLCYQLTVDSVSLGLSSTAGMIEVLVVNQANPGTSVTSGLLDYASWSKTAVSGAQTLPTSTNAFLQRQPLDSQNNPVVGTAGTGSWQAVQPDPGNACGLVTVSTTPTTTPSGLNQLLPASEPPATIASVTGTDDTLSLPALPTADVGLMSPQITELLPNPAGTGNDATDEFIELYNPNPVSFDLSGFGLQAGTSVLHNFTFPAGNSLPAQAFIAFYASDTGLSLSNSGGQVQLLDPLGNPISSTAVYGTAADGQAWALAKGSWYWTTSLTPGAANIINQPVAKKSASSSTSKASTAKGVSSKSTAAKAKTASGGGKANDTASANNSSLAASVTPIHPWTLALVAAAALLYGAYEYRADLANYLYRLRKYFRTRRASRV